jgi:hypothetical protein
MLLECDPFVNTFTSVGEQLEVENYDEKLLEFEDTK